MTTNLRCDICGDKIKNPDRSWPRAAGVPQEPVYINGRLVGESHLGCYRLAREYGDPDAPNDRRPAPLPPPNPSLMGPRS